MKFDEASSFYNSEVESSPKTPNIVVEDEKNSRNFGNEDLTLDDSPLLRKIGTI